MGGDAPLGDPKLYRLHQASPTERRSTMKRIVSAFLSASALILGVFVPREEAVAQTTNELIGTWTLVSITLEKDGKKVDFYGPNPQGRATYDASGRVSVIVTRSDLPKFVSNNREAGTPEENKAVVQGSIAYFGTYSVSETDKTLTIHFEDIPTCRSANCLTRLLAR
jgi:hypothetical protein